MKSERILRLTALALLILNCVLSIWAYLELPDIVPTHFNLAGTPDDFGSSRSIFISPALALLFYGVLSLLAGRYAESENERIRSLRGSILSFLRPALMLVFLLVTVLTFITAENIGGRLVRLGICVLLVALPVSIAIGAIVAGRGLAAKKTP